MTVDTTLNGRLQEMYGWCDSMISRRARYCTGTCRFGGCGGNLCFDCSGWCYCAFRHIGIIIPADSQSVARKGRDDWDTVGKVHTAQPGDLLVHDKHNDPYHSAGARGHIGIFVRFLPGGKCHTYEAASSQQGAGLYIRTYAGVADPFWDIRVRVPALGQTGGGGQPPTEKPRPITLPQENNVKMYFFDGVVNHAWITDAGVIQHAYEDPKLGLQGEALHLPDGKKVDPKSELAVLAITREIPMEAPRTHRIGADLADGSGAVSVNLIGGIKATIMGAH